MEDTSRVLIIREVTFLKGEIRNGGRIEVFGYVEGDIAGDLLVVQPGDHAAILGPGGARAVGHAGSRLAGRSRASAAQ